MVDLARQPAQTDSLQRISSEGDEMAPASDLTPKQIVAELDRLRQRGAAQLGAEGDDPIERSYQLGVLSPLGALDRLDVLRAQGPAQRLELLSVLLEEHEEVLRAQLALGD